MPNPQEEDENSNEPVDSSVVGLRPARTRLLANQAARPSTGSGRAVQIPLMVSPSNHERPAWVSQGLGTGAGAPRGSLRAECRGAKY